MKDKLLNCSIRRNASSNTVVLPEPVGAYTSVLSHQPDSPDTTMFSSVLYAALKMVLCMSLNSMNENKARSSTESDVSAGAQCKPTQSIDGHSRHAALLDESTWSARIGSLYWGGELDRRSWNVDG